MLQKLDMLNICAYLISHNKFAHSLEIIPIILRLKECLEHKEDLIKVLINLDDPSYIDELLNIYNVFFHVSLLEKKNPIRNFWHF